MALRSRNRCHPSHRRCDRHHASTGSIGNEAAYILNADCAQDDPCLVSLVDDGELNSVDPALSTWLVPEAWAALWQEPQFALVTMTKPS